MSKRSKLATPNQCLTNLELLSCYEGRPSFSLPCVKQLGLGGYIKAPQHSIIIIHLCNKTREDFLYKHEVPLGFRPGSPGCRQRTGARPSRGVGFGSRRPCYSCCSCRRSSSWIRGCHPRLTSCCSSPWQRSLR